MFSDDDLLPISALQHLLFCERQCALIHVEGLWAENRFTVEGQQLHQKAHDGPSEKSGSIRVARGLGLRSLRLGLTGKADVVEFHPSASVGVAARPFPIEYKRGKPKAHDADRVQLCAQALCLEEMLGTPVLAGALFYGSTRRRRNVAFDETLRRLTEQTCVRLHSLIREGQTPTAVREAKCDTCSLLQLCLPNAAGQRQSASRYFERAVTRTLATNIPEQPDA